MRRRISGLSLAAAALILTGAALAIGSALAAGDAQPREPHREVPVNAGAGDLAHIAAHNSPAIARNPTDPDNLAVASRIDTPRFSCALHVSLDGGARWRRTAVPIPAGEQRKCYAPDVAFSSDGALHLSYVTLRGVGNVPNALWVARSGDGGRTLERPARVAGPRAFQPRIAADPRDANRLYATWLQAAEVGSLRFTTTGNPIVTARSDDGGRTWGRPVRVSGTGRPRVLAPAPAVGSRGEAYVLYLDVGEDRLDYEGGHEGFGGPPYDGRFALVLARSRDGGTRWEESVVDDDVVPIERFVPFIPPSPALAVDRERGRVYAAFHDGRWGSADVAVWALERDAPSWRGPVRVNDTPEGDRTSQHLPQLAVAPGGRLDVVYYDRRSDPQDVRTRVSLQSSSDAARTFTSATSVSARAFDSRIGFGSERDMPELGSRLALAADDRGAVAVWSDTRHGTDASNKQDLLSARVPVGRSERRALRDGGVALAAGGLVALVLARRRRRRR